MPVIPFTSGIATSKVQSRCNASIAFARPGASSKIASSRDHICSSKAIVRTAARRCTASVSAARTAAVQVRAEISYVMIKPDGVQRGLVGEIVSRFEKKGFKLRGLKMFQCTREIAETHYEHLSSKPFFKDLVNYILSGPVVCMVWEGEGVVKSARKIIGATDPLEAEAGTIRGDYAITVGRNIVHGSDSIENGERETGLWFKDGELFVWEQTLKPWLIE